MRHKVTLAVSALAGAMDALTGLMVMLAPEFTLGIMGVQDVYADMIFLRFVGAFVFAVGGTYLLGLGNFLGKGDWVELRVVWKITTWIRIVVCVFSTIAILQGLLDNSWVGVPLTDGSLGAFQAYWLLSERFPAND